MNAKTLRALHASIRKWEKIIAGTGKDQGPSNCPLCKLFHTKNELDKQCCVGCPVAEKTRRRWCLGTPYDKWVDAVRDYDGNPSKREIARCIKIANAELDFLKALVPL